MENKKEISLENVKWIRSFHIEPGKDFFYIVIVITFFLLGAKFMAEIAESERIKPNFIILPSMSCQAACKYCFGPNKGRCMDKSMIDRIIDYIAKTSDETNQNMIKITFHGGEPLTTDFEKLEYFIGGLVNRFSSERLKFSMQSNLWLLTDQHCKLFSKHHFSLGTSLDGPKQINDAQRGENYFDNTMKGIRLAQSYDLPVSVIATFTNSSIKKWKEVFDFFMNEKLPFSIHSVAQSIHSENRFGMTTDEQVNFMNDAFEYYLDHSHLINVPTFNALCKGAVTKLGQVCTFTNCLGNFLAIDPDGGIYSCQRFAGNPQFQLGSIYDAPSLNELFESSMAKRMIERKQQISNLCGDCLHYEYCQGGCIYSAIVEHDVISKPFCEAYQRIFSNINNHLIKDSKSKENIFQLLKYGQSIHVNPLLRKGKAIDLIKPLPPYEVNRNAKRIVAAYLMTQFESLEKSSEALFALGLGKNKETLLNSLINMKQTIFQKRKGTSFDSMLDYIESDIFIASDISKDIEQKNSVDGCGKCKYRFICGGINPYDEKLKCENLQNKANELLNVAVKYLDLSIETVGGTNVIKQRSI